MSPLCLTALIEIDRLRNSRLELRFQGPASSLRVRRDLSCRARREGFDAPFRAGSEKGLALINLVIWLPATFVLGLAAMGICLAFVSACEVIWRRHYNDRSDNPGDGRRARYLFTALVQPEWF